MRNTYIRVAPAIQIWPHRTYFVWSKRGPSFHGRIAGLQFHEGRILGAVGGQQARGLKALGCGVVEYQPGMDVVEWQRADRGYVAVVGVDGEPIPEKTPVTEVYSKLPPPPKARAIIEDERNADMQVSPALIRELKANARAAREADLQRKEEELQRVLSGEPDRPPMDLPEEKLSRGEATDDDMAAMEAAKAELRPAPAVQAAPTIAELEDMTRAGLSDLVADLGLDVDRRKSDDMRAALVEFYGLGGDPSDQE